MDAFLFITSSILLIVLARQDFIHRSIAWPLVPPLYVLQGIKNILANGTSQSCRFLVLNLAFMAFQYAIIYIYGRLRYGKEIRITEKLIGTGDLIFIPLLCVSMSPFMLMIFFTASLLCILIAESILQSMNRARQTIPLAGWLSIFMMMMMAFEKFIPSFHPYIIPFH